MGCKPIGVAGRDSQGGAIFPSIHARGYPCVVAGGGVRIDRNPGFLGRIL
jgi:hypothetical protein